MRKILVNDISIIINFYEYTTEMLRSVDELQNAESKAENDLAKEQGNFFLVLTKVY